MTGWGSVVAVGAALAVLVLTASDPGVGRVADVLPRARSGRSVRGAARAPDAPPAEVRYRGLAAWAAGAGVLVLVGGAVGVLLALATALVAQQALRRLEPRAVVAERERLASDLPVAAHLLASAVRAGAAPLPAIDQVATAVGGPLARRLRRIAAVASLGGDLASTWRSAADDTGIAPLARTVARALDTGAPLAEALDRLATDLRSQQRFEVDRRARAVGVRATAPLGLCFLPAFLLIGVVPVVAGIASSILRGWA